MKLSGVGQEATKKKRRGKEVMEGRREKGEEEEKGSREREG